MPTETTPVPVEITNQADWWVAWLPLARSLVVALMAFLGVVLTNRGSDKRELTKWRRETIMKLSADVLGGTSEIYRRCTAAIQPNNEGYEQDIRVGHEEIQKLGSVGSAILIVGASALAVQCKSLMDACFDVVQTAKELREAGDRYDEAKKDNDSPDRHQVLGRHIATYESAESAWFRSAANFFGKALGVQADRLRRRPRARLQVNRLTRHLSAS